MSALEILRRTFGYDAFRGPQAEIIEHTVGGGDCLVLMYRWSAERAGALERAS